MRAGGRSAAVVAAGYAAAVAGVAVVRVRMDSSPPALMGPRWRGRVGVLRLPLAYAGSRPAAVSCRLFSSAPVRTSRRRSLALCLGTTLLLVPLAGCGTVYLKKSADTAQRVPHDARRFVADVETCRGETHENVRLEAVSADTLVVRDGDTRTPLALATEVRRVRLTPRRTNAPLYVGLGTAGVLLGVSVLDPPCKNGGAGAVWLTCCCRSSPSGSI